MEKWYVYMLDLCNGRHYVGCTVDINRRIKEHKRCPVSELFNSALGINYIGCIEFSNKSEAYTVEKLLQTIEQKGQILLALQKLGDLFYSSWPPPKCSVYNAQLPRVCIKG